MKTKLLTDLERITKTIEYYIGFDFKSKTWRIMRFNGQIFGNFLKKENAAEYARVCATVEYRRKTGNDDLNIDGIQYYDNILEEVLLSDVDLEVPEDEFI